MEEETCVGEGTARVVSGAEEEEEEEDSSDSRGFELGMEHEEEGEEGEVSIDFGLVWLLDQY